MINPVFILVLGGIVSALSATPGIPVLTRVPVNVTAVVGSTVSFHCEASGSPTPDIVIVRKSEGYEPHEPSSSGRAGGATAEVSVFKTLSDIVQADEGWYVCIASNARGHVISEAYLDILEDPCRGVQCSRRKYCHVDFSTMTTECRCKDCLDDMTYRPVCGTDCQTYLNSCHLRKYSCEEGLGLTVAHKGECKLDRVKLTVSAVTDTVVTEGEEINLKCEHDGLPAPTSFRWVTFNISLRFCVLYYPSCIQYD